MQGAVGGAGTHDRRQGRAARRSSIACRAGSATRSGRSRRRKISSRAPRRCSSSSSSGAPQVAFGEKKLAGVEVAPGRNQAARRRPRQEHPVHRQPRAAGQRGEGRSRASSTRSARAARPTWPTSPSTAARSRRSGVRSTNCSRASPRPTTGSRRSTRGASSSTRSRPRRTRSSTCSTMSGSTWRRWASRRRSSTTWPRRSAQLEFMLQEARNTLRTLQHERELAERIEQGIKQLRSKKPENRGREVADGVGCSRRSKSEVSRRRRGMYVVSGLGRPLGRLALGKSLQRVNGKPLTSPDDGAGKRFQVCSDATVVLNSPRDRRERVALFTS